MITATLKPEVCEVEVRVEADADADGSWLEQPAWADRLAAYRRGDFYFVGLYAVARIRFATTHGGWTGLNEIRTPGLWGIESDSGEDYLREVAEDELSELRAQLDALGITDELPSAAAVKIVER